MKKEEKQEKLSENFEQKVCYLQVPEITWHTEGHTVRSWV